jgi:hypothetical protein
MTHAKEYFAKRALRLDGLFKQYPYVTEEGETLIGHRSLKSAQEVLVAEEKRSTADVQRHLLPMRPYPYTERCRVNPESRLYVHTSIGDYHMLNLYKSSDFLKSPHYETSVADAKAYLKKWCPLEK